MKIETEVMGVLSALSYPNATAAVIVEQLDRKMYAKVNTVLEALGGKWNRKAKAHVFGSDARARVDYALTTGEIETGKDIGFFPTPEKLARFLAAAANLRPGNVVLEPSAGTGRLVEAVLADPAHVSVVAVERDPDMRHALSQRAFAYDNRLRVTSVDDFMDFEPTYGGNGGVKRFDRVVMNPPFCKVGKGDHLDHVRHAQSLLQPNGRLVAVLPSSVKFRRDRRYAEFREWVLENGEIHDLPEGSFKESGTGVNTVFVALGAS